MCECPNCMLNQPEEEDNHLDVRKNSDGIYAPCVVRWCGMLVDFRPEEVTKFIEHESKGKGYRHETNWQEKTD